jgi:hypothetical protein
MQTVQLVKPKGHRLIRGAWRYLVTGRPLWGPGDNASFLHDATTDYRAGPVEKLTRARWRRLARRHAALTVPALLALWDWRATALYVLLAALAGGGYLSWVISLWWPQRAVRREFVYPTWLVIARIIDAPRGRRHAVRAVQLPAGYGSEKDDETGEAPELVVRIHLPVVALDEGTQKRIAVAAGQRLGIPDVSASWVVKGTTTYVDLTPRAQVPRSLRFSEVRHYFDEASPTKPFLGLAAKRVPVYADLDNDGPHTGASGGSGTGKSTLMRIFLAKRVASGAGLVVCDFKVTSHPWARRIAQVDSSRVVYVTDEEPIFHAIMAVYAEFERRRELLKTDPEALEGFRPVDLLVEELNSLASRLRTWWGHERRRQLAEAKENGEDMYLPVVPPCIEALAALVQMGRELGIRVHFAAQRLDASALSPKDGGAVRESITNRFLAKYTRQTWAMLCGGVPFEAFPGGPRGIWTAVISGVVTHFRVPVLSNEEAYEIVMAGVAPSGPVLGAARWVPAAERKAVSMSLGEAWELIPGCPSLPALQKAVARAELVPTGKHRNAHLYDAAALFSLYGHPTEMINGVVLEIPRSNKIT